MRTTWWQSFWRWTVVMAAVGLAVGALMVFNVQSSTNPATAAGAGLVGFVGGLAAIGATFVLCFAVPMLAIVEALAWRRRRAWRNRQTYSLRPSDFVEELTHWVDTQYKG